ncbi:MAG: hypothetical protein COA84_13815 [Robiginitomaculum sp.]|nr:MAG: hypothetical protein COA84_13815 [Robiginitomaculum sp.]
MSKDFPIFAELLRKNFDAMSATELYFVDVDVNVMWDYYLSAYPEGENPISRERAEHDCSCCKNFIRNVGNIVSLETGVKTTIWDIPNLPYPYDMVAQKMNDYILTFKTKNVYRSSECTQGQGSNTEQTDNGPITWHHFQVKIPSDKVRGEIPTFHSSLESAAKVFERGLNEITIDSLQTIQDLIADKNLYRGAEHSRTISAFKSLVQEYSKLNSDESRNTFVWKNIMSPSARFRNTVIGTLGVDLSDGKGLDDAVRMFESKVAPENYKRPKSLITKAMIQDAVQTLQDNGLESSLSRRFARLQDVSVNNVLFVDNTVKAKMKDGIEGLLMEEVKPAKVNLDNAREIGIEQFMATILPKARSIDMLVKNKHDGNFVSLTSPNEADTNSLFKWDNDFAWSYDGDIADSSIARRVAKAGGRVKGAKMRVSLAWFNYDDLDIHVYEPCGNHISFNNKSGKLDVDMNVGSCGSRKAVENVSWMNTPSDGKYIVKVDNYTKRESIDVGFELEVECNGQVSNYQYGKIVGKSVKSLTLTVKNGIIVEIVSDKNVTGSSAISQNKWGVTTETLVKVNTMMYSPNYWDENVVGNKHWFFMLDGCLNPDSTRGIYNEFLNSDLEKHRKVFEILGDKTKCPVSDSQLSGLGFSSTKKDDVTVLVKTETKTQPYKIVF